MKRLKSFGTAIWIGVLGFLAAMSVAAAKRQASSAEKWKQKALDEKSKDVEDSVKKANQALTQAKLANAKAGEAKEKAREKIDAIGKKDADMASIVSGWKSSRLRNS